MVTSVVPRGASCLNSMRRRTLRRPCRRNRTWKARRAWRAGDPLLAPARCLLVRATHSGESFHTNIPDNTHAQVDRTAPRRQTATGRFHDRNEMQRTPAPETANQDPRRDDQTDAEEETAPRDSVHGARRCGVVLRREGLGFQRARCSTDGCLGQATGCELRGPQPMVCGWETAEAHRRGLSETRGAAGSRVEMTVAFTVPRLSALLATSITENVRGQTGTPWWECIALSDSECHTRLSSPARHCLIRLFASIISRRR